MMGINKQRADSNDVVGQQKYIKAVIAVCALLMVVSIGYIGYILYQNYKSKRIGISSLMETGESDHEKVAMDRQLESISGASDAVKIARVGREYLFENDIEYFAISTHSDKEAFDRSVIIDLLIDSSIILQAGEVQGWVQLTDNVFNNPFKDYKGREELVSQVKDAFYKRELEEGTLVEYLSVWFEKDTNISLAEMHSISDDEAKSFAKAKLINVHGQFKQKEISFGQAVAILNEDSSLFQEDMSVFRIGGYHFDKSGYISLPYEITAVTDLDDTGNDSVLANNLDAFYGFVTDAAEGDVSEIMTGRYGFDNEEIKDSFFVFYYVSSKKPEGVTFEEWIKSYRDSYKIENL